MSGETFDIVILPLRQSRTARGRGQVVDDLMTPFGKVGVGVAVALRAPQPNIGSVEGLRRTLLDARSVAYIDPASGGTSGIYVARLFQQLGIASRDADQERAGARRAGRRQVARGEAEIALQQASELQAGAVGQFAGMLPAAVQNWTVYAGALSPAARNKDAALTLMSASSRSRSRADTEQARPGDALALLQLGDGLGPGADRLVDVGRVWARLT